jgi:hypothetical protein
MARTHEEERRSPRSKVLLSAVLEWPGRSLPVVLRDLSEHGALVESKGTIPVDSEVLFCRNDLRVRGHVAWVRGPAAGISFARPLNADVLLRDIRRPAPPSLDEGLHRRPGVTTNGLSNEEQRWFDEMARQPTDRGRK